MDENPSGVMKIVTILVAHSWVDHRCYINRKANPEALVLGSRTYRTLVSPGGVKFAVDTNCIHMHKGHVWFGDPSYVPTDEATVAGIITPPDRRRQGHASRGLKALCEAADEAGVRLSLEPVALPKQGNGCRTTIQLQNWYHRHGFEFLPDGDRSIMRRKARRLTPDA